MKLLKLSIVSCILLAALCSSAYAQAPYFTSSSIGNSDGTLPLKNFHYWSIYGTNLSTGSGSTVYFVYELVTAAPPYSFEDLGYSESQTVNNPGYFYESGSQINFYVQAYNDQFNTPRYYVDGAAAVDVCNSNNLCSGYVRVSFTN
jgi:hypothetical protein